MVLGCGFGMLVNVGSGNLVGLLVLLFFVVGSFLGVYGLVWWIDLGVLLILML